MARVVKFNDVFCQTGPVEMVKDLLIGVVNLTPIWPAKGVLCAFLRVSGWSVQQEGAKLVWSSTLSVKQLTSLTPDDSDGLESE